MGGDLGQVINHSLVLYENLKSNSGRKVRLLLDGFHRFDGLMELGDAGELGNRNVSKLRRPCGQQELQVATKRGMIDRVDPAASVMARGPWLGKNSCE
jgi:hypothetical protein